MTERQDSTSPTLSQRMRQFEINKANRLSANSTTGSTVEDFEDFHPRERIPLLTRYPPPKTTIAAILLTIGGIVFLSLGLSVLYAHWLTHGKDRAITLIVLGSISKLADRLGLACLICFNLAF